MSSATVTRVIAAPPARVWAVFTDLSGRVEWLSEVDSVEVVGGSGLGVGTRWRETRVDAFGTAVSEELVITALDPGRSITIALVGAGDVSHVRYQFTPADPGRGGTTVTAIVEHHPSGLTNLLLAFFLGNFAARTAEGHLRDELDELAAACAANETTAA
jgi:uncharacterized protein YndB with AHSA1/START domain